MVGRTSTFQSVLAFFGLTSKIAPQYRINVFSQIHEIVFHGNGGYSHETVYNMPIWLRNFTFNKIKEWYEKSKPKDVDESWTNSETKSEASKNKKIKPPTYVTKVSRKN
jgi:hypothetical protein